MHVKLYHAAELCLTHLIPNEWDTTVNISIEDDSTVLLAVIVNVYHL